MREYPLLRRFPPRTGELPDAQRDLWPRLAELHEDAVLGGAEALYGSSFSAMLGLKALTSFEECDLHTPADTVQARLRDAARSVDRVPVTGSRSASVLPEELR